jgi:hypothetical protein
MNVFLLTGIRLGQLNKKERNNRFWYDFSAWLRLRSDRLTLDVERFELLECRT